MPDSHVSLHFTLTMPQLLLGRFTREFCVLVPVKASETQPWMESSVFMKGHLERVPAATMFTKVSLSAAERARSERATDSAPMNRINEMQRAQLGPEAVETVLEQFLEQLPDEIKAVRLFVICAGNPDWSSGFIRNVCARQAAGKGSPRMAAFVADDKEHRVVINKVHAVETVVSYLRADNLQIPQHVRMGASPPGWENNQPSATSLQNVIADVRCQLSANTEITAAGALQLKDCPEKLKGMATIATARDQFQLTARAWGVPENGASASEPPTPTPTPTGSATVTDKDLTLASFESKYKVVGKSEVHSRGFSFICASSKTDNESAPMLVWLCNDTDSVIKILKDSMICGCGRMKLLQLNAEGMAAARGHVSLRWDFGAGASVGTSVNANSLKIAFEKPGTNGLRVQSCA